MSIFIAGVAMTVNGLTLPGRYAGADGPPNVSQLGTGQVFGGIGLLVLGILIAASALALLGGLPRSRPFAIGTSAVAAVLALAAFVLLLGPARRDLVLLAALAVAVVAFGGASVILARLRR
jgi:type IV secretory pathway TrbD component